MPYVGRDLQRGNYLKLDDISSSFDGSTTTFNLTSGGNAFFPGSAFSIIVSLGGVIQEPESAFQIDRSQIIFATAPSPNDDFFCIVQGVALGVGVPGHNTVNNDQLAKPLSYGDYFRWDSANNRVGINTLLPSTALDVVGSATFSGNVSIGGTLTYEDVANIDAVGIVTARAGIEDKTLTAGRVVYVGANSRLVDNANLTFDGTDVGIARSIFHLGDTNTSIGFFTTDALSVNTGGVERLRVTNNQVRILDVPLTIGRSTVAGNSDLNFGDSADGDTGLIRYRHDDNYMSFSVSGTSEKVRIRSDGNIGINTTIPTKLVTIKADAPFVRLEAQDGSDKRLDFEVTNVGIATISATQSSQQLSFKTTGGEAIRIDSSGLVGIGTDNPDHNLHVHNSSGDSIVTIESTGNDKHSALEFKRTSSGGDGKGAGSIYVTGNTSASEAIMKFAVGHNVDHAHTPSMVIMGNGEVGIGTDNPNHELTVYGDEPYFRLTHTGSTNKLNALYTGVDGTGVEWNSYQDGTGTRRPFIFKQYTTEVLRIASDGRLLLNDISSRAVANVTAQVQLEGTTANTSAISIVRNSASEYPPYLNFGKSRATSTGGTTIVNDNDSLGQIRFSGADGNDLTNHAASIEAFIDGTPGNNVTPGRLIFSTTSATGSDATEKFRISSNGQVCIGSGFVGGGGHLTIRSGGVNSYATQDYQYVGTPSDDDTLAQIRFTANTTGASVIQGAVIKAVADADWGASGDAPTRLEFHTAPDGSATMVNRMTITQDGRIGMHDSTPNNYELDIMKRSTATDTNMRLYNNATGSGNDTILRLHIAGTSAKNILYFGDGDDSNVGMMRYLHSNDSIDFTTGASERLVINSAGITVTGEVAATQDYPTIRPTLDFNFAATKKLDPRLEYQRSGAASFTDKFGNVVLVGDNTPRFDHDPITRESKGLLIEESRTNLFPYGTTPGDLWSSSKTGTFEENTTETTAPDGTFTATKWTFTNSDPYIYHAQTLSANTSYTVTMYVKAGTNMAGDYVQIRIGAAPYSPNGDDITIPTDGTWKRISYTKTVGGSDENSANVGFEPQVKPSGNPASGDVIYIWGAQLEEGGFATSFIPTSGSSATRGRDELTMSGSDLTDVFNNEEGTMFYEASLGDLTNDNQPIVAFRDLGTTTASYHAMGMRIGGGSSGNIRTWFKSASNNEHLSNHSSTGLTSKMFYKHIYGYKDADCADAYRTATNSGIQATGNGSVTGNGTPMIASGVVDELRFGGYYSYESQPDTYGLDAGHIKRFSYWPQRLTNTQLTTYIS